MSVGLILPSALVVTIVPGAVGVRGVVSTLLATVLAAAAYAALAVLFSLSMRHGILAGILYVLLWEGSIGELRGLGLAAVDRRLREGDRREAGSTTRRR